MCYGKCFIVTHLAQFASGSWSELSWKKSIKADFSVSRVCREKAPSVYFQLYNTDPYMAAGIPNSSGNPSVIPEEPVPWLRHGYCPLSLSAENMRRDELEKTAGWRVLLPNSMGQEAKFCKQRFRSLCKLYFLKRFLPEEQELWQQKPCFLLN